MHKKGFSRDFGSEISAGRMRKNRPHNPTSGESENHFSVGKSQKVAKWTKSLLQAQNFLKATAVSGELRSHVATSLE
ncbi:MAG: hypothetical protein CMA86_02065 [Euryarchaeota archaeon]|nr:hypothetical protein [Euryarchaeota archaeon]